MRAKILKPRPLSCVFASSQSQFTAVTDLWISNLAKVSESTLKHDSTSQYFCQGGVLLANNHCLTQPDMHIQCVVLGAQGGSFEPPEPPLDPPLCMGSVAAQVLYVVHAICVQWAWSRIDHSPKSVSLILVYAGGFCQISSSKRVSWSDTSNACDTRPMRVTWQV